MADEKRTVKLPHNLILEDRRLLTITGVADIDSFDEQTVVLFTDVGELTVKGANLHINKLSVETGEVSIEGEVGLLAYAEDQGRPAGLLARLFR